MSCASCASLPRARARSNRTSNQGDIRMNCSTLRLLLAGSALGLALTSPVSQAQKTLGTGAFPNTAAIERQLRRGDSRKADVQRVLGVPNGTGRAEMLPYAAIQGASLGDGPREIWFYDDIEVTDMASSAGVMTMKVRQQILLVFF